MSIKPIDFQVMIPKTGEISKTVQDGQQKNLGMQQETASSMKHKSESEVKTVHAQENAVGPKIKDKQEKDRGNKKDKDKNKDKNKRAKNDSVIDVRL
ncbi:MAG: hypothetical protein Q8942_13315 [Bacillota bacterium]|nr:hypothetical protein [Bacillota bacterium]